ncbi:hypothetical protein GIB67_002222 [Kingdonia uniflora]|uniref:Uncharacterized protein n=1 Tax=Kingdonia uniflora TaxID=39325 RepID=A0A7J7KWT2_9MAGN|nr:hypothetical protein GIB67_002222 [Kingdonia uniflora]
MASMVKLTVTEATPTSFEEFGQVIEASKDGEEFGPQDAQLDLNRGIPRFYIMHLENRPFKFSTITHHASVTQCLGSIGGHVWYLGVAKVYIVDPSENNSETGRKIVQSRCGHYYVPPALSDVRIFRISGPKFVKLNLGTWHAGPLFKSDAMDFYSLELSNTNVSLFSSSIMYICNDGFKFFSLLKKRPKQLLGKSSMGERGSFILHTDSFGDNMLLCQNESRKMKCQNNHSARWWITQRITSAKKTESSFHSMTREMGSETFLEVILAIILPPVGVFLRHGCAVEFWICLLLTVLGYIPGIIYALYVLVG